MADNGLLVPAGAAPSEPRMAMADCALRGSGSRMCLATIKRGQRSGQTVGVMVQYQDGFCICDMGDDDPMEIIHIDDLDLWVRVKRVAVDAEGNVSIEPAEDQGWQVGCDMSNDEDSVGGTSEIEAELARCSTQDLVAKLMDYDTCHDGVVDEAARRLKHLQQIVDEIPQLVEFVAEDCGKSYIDQPSLYQRGTLWRYHKLRAGNQWEDAATPLEAAKSIKRKSSRKRHEA